MNLALLALAACAAEAQPEAPRPAAARAAEAAAPVAGAPIANARPPQARSFAFRGQERPRVLDRKVESPVSLTASDGTGLKLTALTARAVVDDPLAFTELALTFENPQDRIIEGQFRITLPPGASVSRFAMLIDGRWQEGEVVELAAARRAYEDTLHRRQDPALLEQAAGNEFSARVFPIPARGVKQLILSYSQELAARPYSLPLRGLPELGAFDLRVEILGFGKPEIVHQSHQGWVPDHDYTLATGRVPGRAGLRVGDLVVARIVPVPETAPDEVDSLLVLLDTSASRALGFREQAELVTSLVAGLGGGAGAATPIAVACFDQDVELVYEGSAGGFDAAEVTKKILARGALGASDVGQALAWARTFAGKGKAYHRVLLVGDGVATAGATEAAALRQASASLASAGVQRVDALVVGGIRDEAALRNIVTAGLPRDGALVDGRGELPAIAARLTQGARAGVTFAAAGAEWLYPRTLSGVQAGDEVLVYAAVPSGGPLALTVDGRPLAVGALAPAERPLLERAAAQAHIAALSEEKDRAATPAAAAALRKQITDLSIRHRVLTPYTALLVLENDAEYARYHIDRKALADILTVAEHGLTVLARGEVLATAPLGPKASNKPAPRREADTGEEVAADKVEEPMMKKAVAREESDDKPSEVREPEKDVAPIAADPAPASPAPPPPPRPARANLDLEAPDQELSVRRPPSRHEATSRDGRDDDGSERRVNPYTGTYREVMSLLGAGKGGEALAKARGWHGESPGDVMALVALGEALERAGVLPEAARAYGSLIDLFPARADLRRFAGERLERLKSAAGLALAVDTFAKAAAQRPDHPASHRLLGFALVRAGRLEEAFAAVAAGLLRDYPEGRFAGAHQVLSEDLGLVAAAWIKAEPSRRKEILAKLEKAGGTVEDAPSLRFILNWETDANDVDFHIHDGAGNHAYYSSPELASGGRLYADVTTGYGPECFTIRGPAAERAYPYRLQAHYYSRGPMGYGMGKLEIVEHDGHGRLRFEERPFVIMQDDAFVDLGRVTK